MRQSNMSSTQQNRGRGLLSSLPISPRRIRAMSPRAKPKTPLAEPRSPVESYLMIGRSDTEDTEVVLLESPSVPVPAEPEAPLHRQPSMSRPSAGNRVSNFQKRQIRNKKKVKNKPKKSIKGNAGRTIEGTKAIEDTARLTKAGLESLPKKPSFGRYFTRDNSDAVSTSVTGEISEITPYSIDDSQGSYTTASNGCTTRSSGSSYDSSSSSSSSSLSDIPENENEGEPSFVDHTVNEVIKVLGMTAEALGLVAEKTPEVEKEESRNETTYYESDSSEEDMNIPKQIQFPSPPQSPTPSFDERPRQFPAITKAFSEGIGKRRRSKIEPCEMSI